MDRVILCMIQICFIGIMFEAGMVHGCHTDKVYLQPIKEIKFLDDWKEQYENITEVDLSTQTPSNDTNNAERMRSEHIDNVHSRVGYQTWMSFPEYPTIQKKNPQ